MADPALLPYQSAIVDALRFSRQTIAEKSRRIGFTYGLAFGACMVASTCRADGGSDVLYMSYNQDITREFISYCAGFATSLDQAVSEVIEDEVLLEGGDKAIKAFRIEFASGSKIQALPSSARAIRGHQGVAIIDEAAFVEDLDAMIAAAQPLQVWGGRLFVCSTHFGVANPFNRLLTNIRAGREQNWQIQRVTIEDALEQGLYRRICKVQHARWSRRAEAKWRDDLIGSLGARAGQELFCVPDQGGQLWLPLALLEQAARKTLPVHRLTGEASAMDLAQAYRTHAMRGWMADRLADLVKAHGRGAHITIGADIGRTQDLTVIWVLKRTGIMRETLFVLEFSRVTFAEQAAAFHWLAEGWPGLDAIAIDATGIGAQMAEHATDLVGSRAQEVKLSEGWYRLNTEPLKAAFEDKTITIPADHAIIEDLRTVTLIDGVARVPKHARRTAKDGVTRHGDAAIALMLAHAASCDLPPRYECELVGKANPPSNLPPDYHEWFPDEGFPDEV